MGDNLPAVSESRIYQIMDAMDDEIIRAELENRVVKTWVYSYRGKDGKQVEGLSKVGVDAACTEMAKTGHIISEGEVRYSLDPTNKEYLLFVGQATRNVLDGDRRVEMETVNGTKRQWIKMYNKAGNVVDNPFWFEHGSIKALRNARSRLIPEEIKTRIIVFARQQGRVAEVKENGGNTQEPQEQKAKGFKAYLEAMAGLKQDVGDMIYYGILEGYGFKHANQIKDRETQKKIFRELDKISANMAKEEPEQIDMELDPGTT